MWNRKELKAKGKAAYMANFWICVLAALLLTIAGGIGSINTPLQAYENLLEIKETYFTGEQEYGSTIDVPDDIMDYEEYSELSDDDIIGAGDEDYVREFLALPGMHKAIAIIALAAVLGLLIIFAVQVFLLNPLLVGLQRFFVQNSADRNAGLNKDNLGFSFSDKYKSIISSMFTTSLFEMLWTLLFIIPGIYKGYCWRMVPYLVGENPALTGKEARQISEEMMNGNKMGAFIMDLSFIGWRMLGFITFGLLDALFTNPYQAASNAELYKALKGVEDDQAERPEQEA